MPPSSRPSCFSPPCQPSLLPQWSPAWHGASSRQCLPERAWWLLPTSGAMAHTAGCCRWPSCTALEHPRVGGDVGGGDEARTDRHTQLVQSFRCIHSAAAHWDRFLADVTQTQLRPATHCRPVQLPAGHDGWCRSPVRAAAAAAGPGPCPIQHASAAAAAAWSSTAGCICPLDKPGP